MIEDNTVGNHLVEVVHRWRADGALGDLCQLIEEVWRINRDRQDPKLGDDAQLLGWQCHRNILNRAKPLFAQVQDVEADGAQTLEIRFGGKTMHTSKVTSRERSWTPGMISWEVSDVRLRAAQANTQVFAPAVGTLFDRLPAGAFSPSDSDPTALQFLHLAWQGLEEGGTRVFVGFPQIGVSPWLAVMELDNGRPGTGGMPVPVDASPANSPNHDAMAEPEVAVKRRRAAGHEEAPRTGATS